MVVAAVELVVVDRPVAVEGMDLKVLAAGAAVVAVLTPDTVVLAGSSPGMAAAVGLTPDMVVLAGSSPGTAAAAGLIPDMVAVAVRIPGTARHEDLNCLSQRHQGAHSNG
jgi:hypothetical protein